MLHFKRFKQFDVLFCEYVLIQKPCRYFFSISKSIPLKLFALGSVICIDYWDIFTENEATQAKTANTTRFSYYNLGAVSASTVTSALALP